jgi:hypothetical protein
MFSFQSSAVREVDIVLYALNPTSRLPRLRSAFAQNSDNRESVFATRRFWVFFPLLVRNTSYALFEKFYYGDTSLDHVSSGMRMVDPAT